MSTATDPEANGTVHADAKPPFLRRVRIRGYKSIAFCDVTLEPLTLLVGRNASGKSNFLDAIAFFRDVVNQGLPEGIKRHGGRDAILCRYSGDARVSIEIEGQLTASSRVPGTWILRTGDSWTASYGLEIDLSSAPYPQIVGEQLQLRRVVGDCWANYSVKGKIITWEGEPLSHPFKSWTNPDKVVLGLHGDGPFVELFEKLTTMVTYNFNPEVMRVPQKPNPGSLLERDGCNLASVVNSTRDADEATIHRVSRYLAVVTNSVEFAGTGSVGGYETLRFRTQRNDGTYLEFDASSMSDGTLRTLASLVAAYQNEMHFGSPSLVAIEEPETSLHPAAMRALVDALDEATLRTQILLTTHSAEMLDNPTIKPKNVRVVQMIDGQTVIAPVDEASVEIVRRKLNTLGGLERDNLLEPDLDDVERQQTLGRQEQPT